MKYCNIRINILTEEEDNLLNAETEGDHSQRTVEQRAARVAALRRVVEAIESVPQAGFDSE